MTKSSNVVDNGSAESSAVKAPLHVVDLGKAKPKNIRALKEGRGPLMADVADALAEIEASLGPDAGEKILVPVVIAVERKRKRQRNLLGL